MAELGHLGVQCSMPCPSGGTGGNRELPPGGWVARQAHKRVLWAVTRAGWPDGEPGRPAFLVGGGRGCRYGVRVQPIGQ